MGKNVFRILQWVVLGASCAASVVTKDNTYLIAAISSMCLYGIGNIVNLLEKQNQYLEQEEKDLGEYSNTKEFVESCADSIADKIKSGEIKL